MPHDPTRASPFAVIMCEPGCDVHGVATAVRDQLRSADGVHVVGVSPACVDLRRFYDEVLETVGTAKNLSEDSDTGTRIGSRWMDVRYDSRRPDTYRHSRTAQPLHTDGAYDSAEADAVVIMYCEKAAPAGGDTTFVAAADLIAALHEHDPALLDELCTTAICFSKIDRSRTRAIVCIGERGPDVSWNYFRVDPGSSAAEVQLAERFHRFLGERVVGSALVVPIRLKPGEAVIWHDQRLLHGRHAFEAAQDNDRILWKASIELPDARR